MPWIFECYLINLIFSTNPDIFIAWSFHSTIFFKQCMSHNSKINGILAPHYKMQSKRIPIPECTKVSLAKDRALLGEDFSLYNCLTKSLQSDVVRNNFSYQAKFFHFFPKSWQKINPKILSLGYFSQLHIPYYCFARWLCTLFLTTMSDKKCIRCTIIMAVLIKKKRAEAKSKVIQLVIKSAYWSLVFMFVTNHFFKLKLFWKSNCYWTCYTISEK
jgi:hypothetical protein